jgi:hypothetical protein
MKTTQSHASKYAPDLAAAMIELCGDVITKGVTGILEEVVQLHQEKQLLREALKTIVKRSSLDSYVNEVAKQALAATENL